MRINCSGAALLTQQNITTAHGKFNLIAKQGITIGCQLTILGPCCGGPDSATKRVTICGCQFTIGLYGRGQASATKRFTICGCQFPIGAPCCRGTLQQKDLRFAVANSPFGRLVVGASALQQKDLRFAVANSPFGRLVVGGQTLQPEELRFWLTFLENSRIPRLEFGPARTDSLTLRRTDNSEMTCDLYEKISVPTSLHCYGLIEFFAPPPPKLQFVQLPIALQHWLVKLNALS